MDESEKKVLDAARALRNSAELLQVSDSVNIPTKTQEDIDKENQADEQKEILLKEFSQWSKDRSNEKAKNEDLFKKIKENDIITTDKTNDSRIEIGRSIVKYGNNLKTALQSLSHLSEVTKKGQTNMEQKAVAATQFSLKEYVEEQPTEEEDGEEIKAIKLRTEQFEKIIKELDKAIIDYREEHKEYEEKLIQEKDAAPKLQSKIDALIKEIDESNHNNEEAFTEHINKMEALRNMYEQKEKEWKERQEQEAKNDPVYALHFGSSRNVVIPPDNTPTKNPRQSSRKSQRGIGPQTKTEITSELMKTPPGSPLVQYRIVKKEVTVYPLTTIVNCSIPPIGPFLDLSNAAARHQMPDIDESIFSDADLIAKLLEENKQQIEEEERKNKEKKTKKEKTKKRVKVKKKTNGKGKKKAKGKKKKDGDENEDENDETSIKKHKKKGGKNRKNNSTAKRNNDEENNSDDELEDAERKEKKQKKRHHRKHKSHSNIENDEQEIEEVINEKGEKIKRVKPKQKHHERHKKRHITKTIKKTVKDETGKDVEIEVEVKEPVLESENEERRHKHRHYHHPIISATNNNNMSDNQNQPILQKKPKTVVTSDGATKYLNHEGELVDDIKDAAFDEFIVSTDGTTTDHRLYNSPSNGERTDENALQNDEESYSYSYSSSGKEDYSDSYYSDDNENEEDDGEEESESDYDYEYVEESEDEEDESKAPKLILADGKDAIIYNTKHLGKGKPSCRLINMIYELEAKMREARERLRAKKEKLNSFNPQQLHVHIATFCFPDLSSVDRAENLGNYTNRNRNKVNTIIQPKSARIVQPVYRSDGWVRYGPHRYQRPKIANLRYYAKQTAQKFPMKQPFVVSPRYF